MNKEVIRGEVGKEVVERRPEDTKTHEPVRSMGCGGWTLIAVFVFGMAVAGSAVHDILFPFPHHHATYR